MESIEERESKKMRIYVGGLGATVSEHDLRKMFDKLGTVYVIEIIRTKARSFAYIDFSPSSDNSLSKLFSTYNGCAWKGGRLRLEKAKEHYLVRLKHEWEEDSELAKTNVIDASQPTENPTKTPTLEMRQLHIFFPRLRKVKSLPFSGTGKHKYSFPRVELSSSLPLHLCDCEEHNPPSPSDNAKNEKKFHLETQSGGINKNELNIMNSVMSKLFEKENISNSEPSTITGKKRDDNSVTLIDNLQFGGTKEDSVMEEADDDNLILNVVMSSDNCLSSSWKKNEESNLRIQMNSISLQNKKRKSTMYEETRRNKWGKTQRIHPNNSVQSTNGQTIDQKSNIRKQTSRASWSQKTPLKSLVGGTDNAASSLTRKSQADASDHQDKLQSDGQAVPYTATNTRSHGFAGDDSNNICVETSLTKPMAKPAKTIATSRMKKSSWTKLVSGQDSSFTISQVLPSITLENQTEGG